MSKVNDVLNLIQDQVQTVNAQIQSTKDTLNDLQAQKQALQQQVQDIQAFLAWKATQP